MADEEKQTLIADENDRAVVSKNHAVLGSVLAFLWLVMAAGMPFFNKQTFSYLPKGDSAGALTPTLVQMLGAAGLLMLLECGRFLLLRFCFRRVVASWLFGKGFSQKALYLLLPAICYGAVMGLSNTSLNMTSVNFHVLLRMSSIVWVVALSWIVLKERPTFITLVCCGGLIAGTVLASWSDSDTNWGNDGAAAIIVTLASAFSQGAMIVSLRWALEQLPRDIGPFEVTAFNMTVASVVLLFTLALGLDSQGWSRLGQADATTHALVACGVLITGAFQSLHVGLQALALATTVGILQMCTIVPQVILSLSLGSPKPVWDVIHIFGYIISPAFAILYAIHKLAQIYRSHKHQQKKMLILNSEI